MKTTMAGISSHLGIWCLASGTFFFLVDEMFSPACRDTSTLTRGSICLSLFGCILCVLVSARADDFRSLRPHWRKGKDRKSETVSRLRAVGATAFLIGVAGLYLLPLAVYAIQRPRFLSPSIFMHGLYVGIVLLVPFGLLVGHAGGLFAGGSAPGKVVHGIMAPESLDLVKSSWQNRLRMFHWCTLLAVGLIFIIEIQAARRWPMLWPITGIYSIWDAVVAISACSMALTALVFAVLWLSTSACLAQRRDGKLTVSRLWLVVASILITWSICRWKQVIQAIRWPAGGNMGEIVIVLLVSGMFLAGRAMLPNMRARHGALTLLGGAAVGLYVAASFQSWFSTHTSMLWIEGLLGLFVPGTVLLSFGFDQGTCNPGSSRAEGIHTGHTEDVAKRDRRKPTSMARQNSSPGCFHDVVLLIAALLIGTGLLLMRIAWADQAASFLCRLSVMIGLLLACLGLVVFALRSFHPGTKDSAIAVTMNVCICLLVVIWVARFAVRMKGEDKRSLWQETVLVQQKGFWPSDVAVTSNGTVYAADSKSSCVWIWNSAIGLRRLAEGLPEVTHLAADTRGHVWAASAFPPTVWRLCSTGLVCRLTLAGVVKQITDISFDRFADSLALLDGPGARIVLIDGNGNAKPFATDTAGPRLGKPRIWQARSLASGHDGSMYIVDFDGFLTAVGRADRSSWRQLRWTFGISDMEYDSRYGIVFTEPCFRRIRRVLIPDNKIELLFSAPPFRRSGIRHPSAISISPAGQIYICDQKRNLVAMITKSATELERK